MHTAYDTAYTQHTSSQESKQTIDLKNSCYFFVIGGPPLSRRLSHCSRWWRTVGNEHIEVSACAAQVDYLFGETSSGKWLIEDRSNVNFVLIIARSSHRKPTKPKLVSSEFIGFFFFIRYCHRLHNDGNWMKNGSRTHSLGPIDSQIFWFTIGMYNVHDETGSNHANCAPPWTTRAFQTLFWIRSCVNQFSILLLPTATSAICILQQRQQQLTNNCNVYSRPTTSTSHDILIYSINKTREMKEKKNALINLLLPLTVT